MNKALLNYEQAKEELKQLENIQKQAKHYRKRFKRYGKNEAKEARKVDAIRREINRVLNIVHLHKQLRKMFHEKSLLEGK